MNFDEYLTENYGFTTEDKRWIRMHPKAKRILRDSFKMDIAKEQETEKNIQLAQK